MKNQQPNWNNNFAHLGVPETGKKAIDIIISMYNLGHSHYEIMAKLNEIGYIGGSLLIPYMVAFDLHIPGSASVIFDWKKCTTQEEIEQFNQWVDEMIKEDHLKGSASSQSN